ncbi:MAG: type I restriction-modification system subunit M N-terminal domain-containing protein [Candidatus Sumerlaeia bacterium]
MTENDQKQLGKTLWNIADQLRGAMNADDFRDYMLAFLFLRYISDNYEQAAKKELGRDYPEIVDTYQHRKPENRYSRRVEMQEIEENDYNLNISRYVSTAKPEPEIDLKATHAELVEAEKEIKAAKDKHNAFLEELGLPPLP